MLTRSDKEPRVSTCLRATLLGSESSLESKGHKLAAKQAVPRAAQNRDTHAQEAAVSLVTVGISDRLLNLTKETPPAHGTVFHTIFRKG